MLDRRHPLVLKESQVLLRWSLGESRKGFRVLGQAQSALSSTEDNPCWIPNIYDSDPRVSKESPKKEFRVQARCNTSASRDCCQRTTFPSAQRARRNESHLRVSGESLDRDPGIRPGAKHLCVTPGRRGHAPAMLKELSDAPRVSGERLGAQGYWPDAKHLCHSSNNLADSSRRVSRDARDLLCLESDFQARCCKARPPQTARATQRV